MQPLDWWKVKPSSSPPLSRAEVLALPEGMVILRFGIRDWTPALIVGSGKLRNLLPEGSAWAPAQPCFPFETAPSTRLPRLPRLSFALTTEAVRERRKTVTRRPAKPSWWKEGAWFLGVDKIRQAGAQGLCIGRCGPANKEPLVAISQSEVDREGFPHTTPDGFVAMFRSTTPREWDGWVWRLPFSYLEIPT